MIEEKIHLAASKTDTETLKLKTNKIITTWVEEVRKQIHAAKGLSDKEIINGLHEFLSSFEELTNPEINFSQKIDALHRNISSCQHHGEMRAKLKFYTLDMVVDEYRILRGIISRMLKKTLPNNKKMEMILIECIDNALIHAATEFTIARSTSQLKLDTALSERKDALEKLDEANLTIENMGTEKTAREHFVSALSHDLRNPLSAARMSAQLIERDPNVLEYIKNRAERIITNIDRADKMIRDLLDANRIKSGHPLPLHKKSTNLTGLFLDIVNELKLFYGNRIIFKSTTQIFADVDPQSIIRIIENLVNNADKYGSPHAEITLQLIENETTVSFSVHNKGNPISEEDQESIFEPFRRSESADASISSGWGIGLTLVKGLTQAHGGQIKLTSSKNEGTTFTVIIPK